MIHRHLWLAYQNITNIRGKIIALLQKRIIQERHDIHQQDMTRVLKVFISVHYVCSEHMTGTSSRAILSIM